MTTQLKSVQEKTPTQKTKADTNRMAAKRTLNVFTKAPRFALVCQGISCHGISKEIAMIFQI